MLVNDASYLTLICFTAANHKIKTQFSNLHSETAHQNKKMIFLFRSKMSPFKNGRHSKWTHYKMVHIKNDRFKNDPIENLSSVGNGPTFKLLLMKTVSSSKVFASLCKIIRQPQASNTPLCHKTIKHSNQCVFRTMQTDEFGVSDFSGSSNNNQNNNN